MIQKTFLFIFIFIFFYPIFSQSTSFYDYPPHQSVYSHNLNLVSQSSFVKQRPPWLTFQEPSLSNPFHYAFFKFTSLYPSVSNRTSANKIKNFFWIWGEDHPDYYIIYLTPNACGQPYRSFRVAEKPSFGGTLKVSLDSISKSYQFDQNSQDPFPIQFSDMEISLLKTKANFKEPVLPILDLQFEGEINISYNVFEMDYIVEITKNGINCRAESRTYIKKFSYPVSDRMIFEVEHSKPLFYLLQPIDNEQLSFSPQAKFVFLSNAYANKIWLTSANFIASNRFASYSIKTDPFSFQNIYRENLQPPLKENKIFSNSTFKFLNSSFFIKEDHNFAHQYFSHAFLPYSIGKRPFSFHFLDDFNQIYSFDKELTFRSASGLRQLFSNSSFFQTDNNASISQIYSLNNTLFSPLNEKNRASYYTFFDSIKFIIIQDQFLSFLFILGLSSIALWLRD
ncbi:MAG: hypothetical protein ACK4J0_03505 [Candidatus Anstonellaceae archaeon]